MYSPAKYANFGGNQLDDGFDASVNWVPAKGSL
jgi:hypothetical protein